MFINNEIISIEIIKRKQTLDVVSRLVIGLFIVHFVLTQLTWG